MTPVRRSHGGFCLGDRPTPFPQGFSVLGLRLAKGRETGPWVDCEALFFCHDRSRGMQRTSTWTQNALKLLDKAGLAERTV
ncbi:hypothetical protein HPC62_03765 [Thermoleptolyngbya sichuanensis A183]|uniref:Uncharacterized protein n=1 Tax=Thermoleptolyngbya sichuanensis A183 TaxID=2737172 RepID=A0A6M8BE05_9CYAN|nr:hypothetical protein [Thermoleptolyngbya sichuanensis]QKD81413.1 hypothetical protein HPC62_03765 [Thermoleptolyngbya sichuanensis A183]